MLDEVESFNRTILGLKHKSTITLENVEIVLIEPFWD